MYSYLQTSTQLLGMSLHLAKSFPHGSYIPQWKIDHKLERKIKTINKQWIACCDHVCEGTKQRNIK